MTREQVRIFRLLLRAQAMKIIEVEDLLIEILLRLPPKSLLRFQCVSKRWLSIISGPDFRRLHSCRLSASAVTGLFFAPPSWLTPRGVDLLPHFVSLKLQDENPQYSHTLANRLTGLCGCGPINSLNSCNGVLCIWFLDENDSHSFYVYNPTTDQLRRIPDPFPLINKRYEIRGMNIAFDPSKSHHYNLVCVYLDNYNYKIRFSVFSSESRVWRESGEQLPPEFPHIIPGAFLNGAIHWHWSSPKKCLLCFDVGNARLRPMPCIPLSQGLGQVMCAYFGEFGGHLRFIEQYGGRGSMLMNVFEMENDYSQWVLKNQVDLTCLKRFFPPGFPPVAEYGFSTCGISVHFIVGDDEGKEGLVISVPGKIILYHMHDMSITQLTVWPELFSKSSKVYTEWFVTSSLGRYSSCKHIETLAYV